MTRVKFTPKFKAKVAVEAIKGRLSTVEMVQKYNVTTQQISTWKQQFLREAESVFAINEKSAKTIAEEEKDQLLRTIGSLKVELDFLKKALR